MSILPQPIREALRQLRQDISCHFLQGSCLLCSSDSLDQILCPACQQDLPGIAQPCPRCAHPLGAHGNCMACAKALPHIDKTLARFQYIFPVDRIIQSLKYGHQLAIAPWLGEQMATHCLTGDDELPEIIIPMPLHPERLRERGFNQSIELAKSFGRQVHRPVLIDTLFRIRATPPQASLSLKQRLGNLNGAFECREDLSGRSILLLDDVMTTGATVNEAARVLKLHGASVVWVAVAARALRL